MMLYTVMTTQHKEFFPTLDHLPVTTLDAEGRPWASILTSSGNRNAVAETPASYSLLLNPVWELGDPAEANLRDGMKVLGTTLIAGVGVEMRNRRRNKFAGYLTDIETVGETTRYSCRVNIALGCAL